MDKQARYDYCIVSCFLGRKRNIFPRHHHLIQVHHIRQLWFIIPICGWFDIERAEAPCGLRHRQAATPQRSASSKELWKISLVLKKKRSPGCCHTRGTEGITYSRVDQQDACVGAPAAILPVFLSSSPSNVIPPC